MRTLFILGILLMSSLYVFTGCSLLESSSSAVDLSVRDESIASELLMRSGMAEMLCSASFTREINLVNAYPSFTEGSTRKEDSLYCPWVIYYADAIPAKKLLPYDPIVLDPDEHPPLESLKKEDKTLYGYVNLGEVETYRSHFEEAKMRGLLLEENPNWPGAYYVDMRKEGWARLLLDQVIPEILTKGFNGLFLDTLDNPIYLEERDPEKFEGMKKAAAELVLLIGVYFPEVPLMMNRAFELIPLVGETINSVLAESIYTTYNFEKKSYERVPEEHYLNYVNQLHEAQKAFPHLHLFSLDYWYPEQIEEIARIYQVEREHGLQPYVATVQLDKIVKEPK